MDEEVDHECKLPVIFLKEKGQFVAYTPALDLSTVGKTLVQAEGVSKKQQSSFLRSVIRWNTGRSFAGTRVD